MCQLFKRILNNIVLGSLITAFGISLFANPVYAGISDSVNLLITIDYGPPQDITNLNTVHGSGYGEAELSWTAPDEDPIGMEQNQAVTGYDLRYATSPFNISNWDEDWITSVFVEPNLPKLPGMNETYTVTGLTGGTSYYFAIRTYDDKPNYSGLSNLSTIWISIVPTDTIAPLEPRGINGNLLVGADTTIKIIWNAVTVNIDNSPCTDLAGYNIYRAPYINGPYVLVDSVTADKNIWMEPEDITGKVYYYKITARDSHGNESKDSMIVDSSRNGNILSVSGTNPMTYIEIPKSINYILFKDSNVYSEDLWIRINPYPADQLPQDAISMYEFELVAGLNTKISNFSFDEPVARVSLSYEVEAGYGKEALQIGEGEEAENLAIFWNNGIEWVKLGGDVSIFDHTVTVNSKRLGTYAIMKSKRSDTFAIESIQPDKVFTPNGDTWNDYVEIQYTNPYDANVEAKIYDLQGYFIVDMEKDTENQILKWSGKDQNGEYAHGGIYIYQISVSGEENKVLNGTVVLIR